MSESRVKSTIYFDRFSLDPVERTLRKDGVRVDVNPKTFDVLLALIDSRGSVVTKDELLNRVWGDQFVEENNLTVNISLLRKTLGEKEGNKRFIVTVPGKGYSFVAEVMEEEADTGGSETGELSDTAVKQSSSGDTIDGQTQVAQTNWLRTAAPVIAVLLVIGVVVFAGYRIIGERSFFGAAPDSAPMSITRITDGKYRAASTISPDGKFVASIENSESGTGMLYVHQVETNTVSQILEADQRTFGCVNFAPDGSHIYYVVFDRRDPYSALYKVPVLGGLPKRMIEKVGACFAVSPDDKQVAFFRTNSGEKSTSLVIAELATGEERRLVSRPHEKGKFGMGLAWSPDGKRIAFSENRDPGGSDPEISIMGVGAQSGEVEELSGERFVDVAKMVWAADSSELVFVGFKSNKNELFSLDLKSGGVRQITNDLERYGRYGLGVTADSSTLVADIWDMRSVIWSVDANDSTKPAVNITTGNTDGRHGITALPGGKIAYTSRTSKSLEIWIAKEDRTEPRALTTDSFEQRDVVASPDGRHLIYASDQTGTSHIYRMNTDDGTGVKQLTFGKSSNSRPDISPDGKWIVYRSQLSGTGTVWKVPFEGGEPVQLTKFESGSPVFSPDGNSVACIIPSDSRAKLGSIAVLSASGGEPSKSFRVLPFSHNYQTIRWAGDGTAIVFAKLEKGVSNIWKQPINGGDPKQITGFSNSVIRNFAYSGDGKRLFVSRGATYVDVVLIKNYR